jgi:hypothetical protein
MISTKEKILSKREFYTGLLLAIATKSNKGFPAEGAAFHNAFAEALKVAMESSQAPRVEGQRWITVDPLFGVVHEADEMLLFGENSKLLSLGNPAFHNAGFKLTSKQAAAELEETGYAEWFGEVADRFLRALGR